MNTDYSREELKHYYALMQDFIFQSSSNILRAEAPSRFPPTGF